LGLVLGYGKADADAGTGFGAKTEGYNWGATLRLTQGNLFVNAGYTEGELDAESITRPAAYGLTAVGAADGHGNAGFIDAGFTIPLDSASISPMVGYHYGEANFDAYVETGAAGGNIAVPKHSFTSNIGSIGAEAAFTWGEIIPVVKAAYNKEFTDQSRNVTLKLASATAAMASETVTVPATKEDFISTGVGLQGPLGQGLWHVGYTAEFGRDDRFGHAINAGVALKF